MVKIKMPFTLLLKVYFLFVLLVATGCSSIKVVTVKNSTNERIIFHGQFITKSKNTDDLEFALNPGEVNSWRYEISSFEKDKLDKGLNKIILSDQKGCTVELDRSEIDEIANNQGMWVINIDQNLLNCE